MLQVEFSIKHLMVKRELIDDIFQNPRIIDKMRNVCQEFGRETILGNCNAIKLLLNKSPEFETFT